jgi:hypothetical protein
MIAIFRHAVIVLLWLGCLTHHKFAFGQKSPSKEANSLNPARLQKASKRNGEDVAPKAIEKSSVSNNQVSALYAENGSDASELIGINTNEFNKAAIEQLNKNKIEGKSLLEGIYKCLEVKIPDGINANLNQLKKLESNPEIIRLEYTDESRIFVYCKARFKSEDIKQLFGAHGIKVYGLSEHYSLLP